MENPIIIVLDDSSLVCGLIRQSLESEFNAQVHSFTKEDEVPDSLISKSHVVIVDYFLGTFHETEAQNGVSFVKRVKRINPNSKIVAFSGQKNISVALNFIESGATDYIDKNKDNFLDELLSSVSSILKFQNANIEARFLGASNKLDSMQFYILLITSLTIIAISLAIE